MDSQAPTQSPGWYTDPDSPSELRYWDGDGWTDDRRDKPDWLGPDGDVTPKSSRSTRRIFTILAVIGVLLCAFVWFTIPKRPARSVSDTNFLAKSERICDNVVPTLRAERKPERKLSDDEVANRIDEVANKLTVMVSDLRDLPVAAADQAAAKRWLANWDKYIAVGRQYADAIRDGDGEVAEQVRRRGDDADRALGRFASGNRIDSCIPFSLA